VVLFSWAAIDQLHFYWSTKMDSLPALERAAKLNPDDSSIQARLARASALAGKRDLSLAALRRAAEIRPNDFPQQEAYARGLIETGRDADAYAQYQNILMRWPRNVDALTNFGVLALRLGHVEEAIDSWQSAVTIDPAQTITQLYLAQALDRQGEAQAAARHYWAYLQIVASHPKEHANETAAVLAALIKVADADANRNQPNEALKGYEAAIQFAKKANDKTLESLALVHLADLQGKLENAPEAAQAYQRALALDASLADPVSAASDWLNYGKFLYDNQLPERFAFACFLHAEELVKKTPGPVLTAAIQARTESEARLGREASAVRRSGETIAKEALAIPPESFAKSH
jgi:tetratricopeptide (TPR) repeat protein